MASNSKTTKFRRALRQSKAGRGRKAALRIHGTTPAFAVHTPEADANAPDQAKPDCSDS